ncbi:MAG: hypothetical protein K2X76_04400, partial [Sphingomonas sp.]|nr:hypothetical protein [Sphingomonas sp.]
MAHRSKFVAVLLAVGAAGGAAAQEERPAPPPPAQGEEAFFTGLSWRNIGPNRGGRSIAAAGSAARPNEYFFAA